MRCLLIVVLGIVPALAFSEDPITIRIDASARTGPFKPVWNYFGYDEPNYTYAPNGRKLINELAALSYTPVRIRTHNLLTTGNGISALKWGSTNAYTEDKSGKPIYDWTIVDRILETYLEAGAKPLVEIGFMPKALSTHPDPYQHNFPQGEIYTGWSYPPNNYEKWSELVYQWVKHCVDKYGRKEADTWQWEVWNEPNIGYWHGAPDEYDKLYDHTTAAVRRALPTARVGGPASTGPADPKAAAFLRQFLQHCSSGMNASTGKQGAPLDFISFHVKGRPDVSAGHIQMGISRQLADVSAGFDIVESFTQFRNLPIVLTEADPEGCAACSARVNPRNAYRNGTLYPSYEAIALKSMLELADRKHVNLAGVLTWAFEFESQPYFEGFRTLATNGIDKPVLNFFRMCGLMHGEVVRVESSGAIATDAIVESGVRQRPDIDALAVRSDHGLSVLVCNYQDDDISGPAADVRLQISGLPSSGERILLRHYRIDETHSNAFTRWKKMGSPQNPTPEMYKELEQAGQLHLIESPHWIDSRAGATDINFWLPLQGLSLVELSW